MTSSQDVLMAIADDQGPQDSLVVLGYAGWGPGQLEQEIQENLWLNGDADPNIIFELPFEKRWEATAQGWGIDLSRLSGDVGHS